MFRLRRGARVLLCLLAAFGSASLAVGCGSTSNQLTTTLAASSTKSTVSPGETPAYVVKVVNKGPGLVNGVTIHVDLPPEFRYKSTTGTDGHGFERTQLVDASVNSPSPEWGLWSLPAPVTQADGTVVNGELDLTFTVDVEGSPGSYSMAARASSDSSESDALSAPLGVTVAAAPHVSVVLAASPGNIHPNDVITYTLTATNDGTGAANAVSLLVTLPAAFQWKGTVSIGGNSSRASATDPILNTSLVDYGGFTIPARSDAGPGVLVVTFHVQCAPQTPSGAYPVSGQLTEPDGLTLEIRDTVPVNVIA